MIPPGLEQAIVAWATDPSIDDATRTTRKNALRAERDACVTGVINAGKGLRQLESGSENGKSFTALSTLTAIEKLTVLNGVLDRLGMNSAEGTPVTATFATFGNLRR